MKRNWDHISFILAAIEQYPYPRVKVEINDLIDRAAMTFGDTPEIRFAMQAAVLQLVEGKFVTVSGIQVRSNDFADGLLTGMTWAGYDLLDANRDRANKWQAEG
ncbi:hypothetical protein AW889_01520 [Pseudomonas aeruginosa]|uniref:DUF2513 domain-containing protein n=1 Tax=Pseudomonas aeruginosa TaxID=287 RepID=UPI00053E2601|nr:DUF2513 domain-containing protein [Pseudomonas aeruginosa]EKY4192438.1 DUF2513 domain-containing protein [Pseudomonas aeruginosa]ELL1264103.1 DUF2513 domain-containing protein [Pseudomonas aeruginosa]ELT3994607.1 DUF2513 domain-containing protein [Pseudomonas aeruginosa]EME5359047.1 DUF2513 domain-containing protein [Pseudomonas aeruginosa]KSP11754.1 hypothetical protein APB08_21030 [Pseudomonas aeruginosa]